MIVDPPEPIFQQQAPQPRLPHMLPPWQQGPMQRAPLPPPGMPPQRPQPQMMPFMGQFGGFSQPAYSFHPQMQYMPPPMSQIPQMPSWFQQMAPPWMQGGPMQSPWGGANTMQNPWGGQYQSPWPQSSPATAGGGQMGAAPPATYQPPVYRPPPVQTQSGAPDPRGGYQQPTAPTPAQPKPPPGQSPPIVANPYTNS